jgi:hypothetical protein
MEYTVYCFPICGGAFPCTLSLLQELSMVRERPPDLCLASSGGTLAALLGLSANWDPCVIEHHASCLSAKMFVQRWAPSYLPEPIMAFLMGSVYDEGCGGYEFFQRIMTQDSLTSCETWIGTYDSDERRAQFFCNKTKGESRINSLNFNEDQDLFLSKSVVFCDGDLESVYRVTLASSSIPMIVPPKTIMGSRHSDGGVMYASPLSVFYKEIARIIAGIRKHYSCNATDIPNTSENEQIILTSNYRTTKRLRLFYFMGSESMIKTGNAVYDTFVSVLNSAVIRDRNKTIELLELLSPHGVSDEFYPDLCTSDLARILKHHSDDEHYVVCLFPHGTPTIRISDFCGKDVVNVMENVRNHYGCRIWYSNRLN